MSSPMLCYINRCQHKAYRYTNLRSKIKSVINLWNSLDNQTRNTRTFETFLTKRKVVLVKISGHFVVRRRSNTLYPKLRGDCSSLKNDIFRSNITTDSRCVCGHIREDAYHLHLNCRLVIDQETVLFIFLHHHRLRRDIRTLLFGDSQKDQAQHILISKAVQTFIKHSKRRNIISTHVTYLISFMCSYTINDYILIICHALCQTCLYDTWENFI
jgi:hypothetical protein